MCCKMCGKDSWCGIKYEQVQHVELAIAVCPWLRVGISDLTLRLVECQSLKCLPSDQINIPDLFAC